MTPGPDALNIHNNEASNRFEATVDQEVAFVEYKRMGDTIELTHTIVPPAIEGRGVGTALAEYALLFARTNSLCVIPTCGFIAAYIESHPEYSDLTTPTTH